MEYILAYIAFINIMAIFICCLDKYQARVGGWRINERLLFAVSVIGGAFGMYFTMRAIRHKTLHKRFMIGLPIIIVLQLVIAYYLTNSLADIKICV